jgi:L-lactate dehydrogenase (cytochrome)
VSRRLRRILSLDDFEPAAKRHLPRPLFGYVAGGVENDRAYGNNARIFQDFALIPRVLVDVSLRTQAVELFGRVYASPFGISPMGLSALTAYRGDIVIAQAAQAANVPMMLSGTSLIPMEDVMREAPASWFQAYVPGNADRIDALIDRVAAAGFEALVVTVDTCVPANRENNIRTGFSTPLRPSPRLAFDGFVRPRWLFGTFGRTLWRHGMPHFENSFAERGAPIVSSTVLRDFSARDHLDWSHLERIRARWKGHLVLKGILSSTDAARAKQAGIDGIIVSNHGGRQLDGAVSPLTVLPDIVAAVGNLPVMLDGGIRRGTDVMIALALGARMVFVGRPFAYAAAIAGQEGVEHGIGLLRAEVDRNMAMLGVSHCREMAADRLVGPAPAR